MRETPTRSAISPARQASPFDQRRRPQATTFQLFRTPFSAHDLNTRTDRKWFFAAQGSVDALLTAVLRDGQIDPQEHAVLLRFFKEFSARPGHRTVDLCDEDGEEPAIVTGICAVCPEISFDARQFCFTGASKRSSREEMASHVERLGAKFSKTLVKTVDYLVIGANGNPCWAYACYGRKVEQAIKLRRQGSRLLLVHENDFWDAVEDASI